LLFLAPIGFSVRGAVLTTPMLRQLPSFEARTRFVNGVFGASHGARRNRRIALSILASGGARGLQMITTLALIPLAYGYLGVERFGFWVALTSATAFLAFADLGIGNGLINRIAEAEAREDYALAQVQLSTAFWMLCAIALGLGAAFVPLFLGIDWPTWFRLSASADPFEVNWSIIAAFSCFAIQIPLSVASKVRAGHQEGYLNSMFEAFGSCCMVAGVFAVVHWGGGLAMLVLCASGVPALGSLANLVDLIWRKYWLRPSWRTFSPAAARNLLTVGSMFFLVNLSAAFTFTSDTVLAIRIFGPETAASFSIGVKLFGVGYTVAGICLLPLWPAYSEAMGRMDTDWVRRAFARSTLLSLAASALLALLLFFVANPLASLWLRTSVLLPVPLSAALAFWMVVQMIAMAVGIFFSGTGLIRFVTTIVVICAVVAFPAKILLSHAMGPSGIIWASVLSYVAFIIIPSAIVIPKFFRRIDVAAHARIGGRSRQT
jgi:O-antigen/teichoic acid export membrane protein